MSRRIIIRRLPATTWLQVFVSTSGRCEPGSGWTYTCVYRRAWRIGRVGFGWLWMPSTTRIARRNGGNPQETR